MSEAFDPYRKWLGIPSKDRPPKDRPPNHYRLLSLELFEEDADAISNAADRQMAHVRTFQTGEHSALSQKLLNELSAARVCLLNREKKAEYDAVLRRVFAAQGAAAAPEAVPPAAPLPTVPTLPAPQVTAQAMVPAASVFPADPRPLAPAAPFVTRTPRRASRRRVGGWQVPAAVVATIALLAGAVYVAFDLQRGTDVEHSPPGPGKKIGVTPEPDQTRKHRRPHDDSPKKATKTTPDTPPGDSRNNSPASASASSNDEPTGGNRGPSDVSTPSPPSPPGQNDLPPTLNPRAPLVNLLNTAEKKASVPSAADRTSARRTAEEKFQQDLQTAKTPEQKLNVARKSQRAALDAKPDSAERYALLDQARELAAGAGSSKVAFEAIDGLAKWFEIEELELRLETLEVAAKAPNSPTGKAAKKEQLDSAKDLIKTCVAIDRFPEALRAAVLAQAAARSLRDQDPGLAKQLAEEKKDLEKLAKAFAAIKDDLERLKADAGDAAANLAVGRFYCLAKKDWARGLPHLVAGEDATLKDLAQRELAKPSGSEDEKSLGDEWWELSRKERGPAKAALAGRACFWYRRSLTFLSGVEKEAVEQKLEEAGETGRTDTTQFLSELPETNVVVENRWFAKGRNAVVNKAIQVGGKESPHGLFTHPTTNGKAGVSYDLGKKAKRLSLDVAIDDGASSNPRTALLFQVWGDGALLQVLGPVALRGQVLGCQLNVANVKILELRTICAGKNNFAHAVWLEPRVTWK